MSHNSKTIKQGIALLLLRACKIINATTLHPIFRSDLNDPHSRNAQHTTSMLRVSLNRLVQIWPKSGRILVAFIILQALSSRLIGCPPGDGPKPLLDITNSLQADLTFLDSQDSVRDFLLWQKSGRLIFRNQSGDIMDLADKHPFTSSIYPLAKLNDSNERYLTTANDTGVFDTKDKKEWNFYPFPSNLVQHLFWQGDSLFSIGKDLDEKGTPVIHFFEYNAKNQSIKKICKDIEFTGLKLASGHSYPRVYFYNETQGPTARTITIYSANLGFGCKILPLKSYTRTVSGPVKHVHVFKDQNAYAIEIDNPEKNLLWDSQKRGCNYFNVHGDATLIPSYTEPTLLTWSPKRGIRLVFPDRAEIADISRRFWYSSSIKNLNQSDVSFLPGHSEAKTGDLTGSQIFMAPRFTYDNQKWLFKLALRQKENP